MSLSLDQRRVPRFFLRAPAFFLRRPVAFLGTFLPSLRASDKPMAMACLRLLTFPPLPPGPLFNLPCLNARISRSTSLPALFEYLRAMIALLLTGYLDSPKPTQGWLRHSRQKSLLDR